MQTDKRRKYLYNLTELGLSRHGNKENSEQTTSSNKLVAENKRLEEELSRCQ